MLQWFIDNWLEIFGAASCLLYIYLEIKQRSSLWIVGIISSAIYVVVFFQRNFLAFAALYVYYVAVSIYGIYSWRFSKGMKDAPERPVIRLNITLGIVLAIITVAIFFITGYVLNNYVDFPAIPPYYEALATSLSVVATWMLARKILEQWYVWIFVNFFSSALYFFGGLYPTGVLFVIYGIMSVTGLMKWKQSFNSVKVT